MSPVMCVSFLRLRRWPVECWCDTRTQKDTQSRTGSGPHSFAAPDSTLDCAQSGHRYGPNMLKAPHDSRFAEPHRQQETGSRWV